MLTRSVHTQDSTTLNSHVCAVQLSPVSGGSRLPHSAVCARLPFVRSVLTDGRYRYDAGVTLTAASFFLKGDYVHGPRRQLRVPGFSQVRYGGNIGETQFHWLTGEDLDQKLSSESTSGQLHSAINIVAHIQDTCFDTCPADPPRKGTVCVVAEFCIFASSTDNLNIITLDHMKKTI